MEICESWGLTGFYRCFVRHYSTFLEPLKDLLKVVVFSWSAMAMSAFNSLKSAMTSLPVLTLPNFAIPFDLTTDASTIAISVVLSQQGHTITFVSKKMCPQMQTPSTYVRELYAITKAVKKWPQYLLRRTFRVFTNHKSFKQLVNQMIQMPE
ncbi:UNVERIFIED_CONTAM: putative mitochondrial protein [Sesamum calycinum]|uniref:Mitochondrial protein n=1 Tax=Sesamum calycinum TaxID=2727403 RepID=A0AAW2LVB5_9LAMI